MGTCYRKGTCQESIILQGTKISDRARVEYAILDKGCVVEPGARHWNTY